MQPDLEILNLDTIIPRPRYIELTEKAKPKGRFTRLLYTLFPKLQKSRKHRIDVSRITVRTSLEMDKFMFEFVKASVEFAKNPNDEQSEIVEEMMYTILEKVCQPSAPWVTRDWLMDNLTPDQVIEMFTFILRPYKERIEKNAERLQAALADQKDQ
jgi:hypothetical protein